MPSYASRTIESAGVKIILFPSGDTHYETTTGPYPIETACSMADIMYLCSQHLPRPRQINFQTISQVISRVHREHGSGVIESICIFTYDPSNNLNPPISIV